MRKIALSLLLLPSCMGSSQNIEVPVTEVTVVSEWVATMPSFDTDQDGVLNNSEWTGFLLWLGSQAIARWAVPTPTVAADE